MKSSLNFFPNGENKKNLTTFINELEKRYDKSTRKLNVIVSKTRNYDLSFYFMKFEKQIDDCENYCKEGNKLEIYFIDSENKHMNIVCIPLEIKYYDRSLRFSVFNTLTRQIIDIPIDKIRNINLLSTNYKDSKKCTTVLFKIKGQLIKNYELRTWEKYIENVPEDAGYKVIENSGEDFNALITRLFKYHENCEVIAPKFLQNKMIKMINNTLKNYDL